jgi:PelA/Pel-15E family pectate lyase
MKRLIYRFFLIGISVMISFAETSVADPTADEVIMAIHKASKFLVDEVSYKGGYLWRYTEDLSRAWGEAPARPTQIEVHQAGTPHIGEVFVRAYEFTGDEFYLIHAKKAANVIIWGQHPAGGWHYFIDFDMPHIRQWYEEEASKFKWGMQEYRHYYGNCSFDDGATQDPTRFLLALYMCTLDPMYREPLLKALNFVLEAQYPNGAWPQRYPLMYEYAQDGHADYTSYYTFNDGVARMNIELLMEAYIQLGNEEYLKAAKRGMDFYLISQGPENQAGWCEQHGKDLMPAWGRTHEPPAYTAYATGDNIRELMTYYLMTGDRQYLEAIGKAIKWLEDSTIEVMDDGRHKLAMFYEVGTNRPLYMHNPDNVTEEGYGIHLYDYDPTDYLYESEKKWWNPDKFTLLDVQGMKREYQRLQALIPSEAVAEYTVRRDLTPRVDPEAITQLIDSLDDRGAWVEDIKVFLLKETTMNGEPAYSGPNENNTIRGISMFSFVRNMNSLMDYLEQTR